MLKDMFYFVIGSPIYTHSRLVSTMLLTHLFLFWHPKLASYICFVLENTILHGHRLSDSVKW
jgi:hypothetical protein